MMTASLTPASLAGASLAGTGVRVLTDDACWELLRSETLGRLAVVADIAHDPVVALEVDDATTCIGGAWSCAEPPASAHRPTLSVGRRRMIADAARDEAHRARVVRSLEASRDIDVTDVHVAVADGVVTLSGEVGSSAQHHAVRSMVVGDRATTEIVDELGLTVH